MGFYRVFAWINENGEIEVSSQEKNIPAGVRVWAFLVPAFTNEWDEIVLDLERWDTKLFERQENK